MAEIETVKVRFLSRKGFYVPGEEAVLYKDVAKGLVERKIVEYVVEPVIADKPTSKKQGDK
jgi:hypothetical protein